MRITLKTLKIENFRSHANFQTEFGEKRTTITAANGVGKTSVYDAFLWLLFGKSTDGRSQYEYRPLDAANEPVRGLVVAVEAVLSIDGVDHTFRKEEQEHVTKHGKYSYPASYWIDQVPKLLKDYQANIQEIIPEDTFKMLTDLSHFNSKLHWTDRRQVLMDIAGNVGTPAGFEGLIKLLNGRTVDEMKKVIAEQKKAHEKERDEIGPQIRAHQEYANYQMTESEPEMIKKRDLTVGTIDEIEAARKKVIDQQFQRQTDIDALNSLKADKIKREAVLANDTSGTEKLRAEAEALRQKDADLRTEVATLTGKIGTLNAQKTGLQNELTQQMVTRTAIQKEYSAAKNDNSDDIAFQALEHTHLCMAADEKLRDAATACLNTYNEGQAEILQCIKDRGNKIQKQITAQGRQIIDVTNLIGAGQECHLKAEALLLCAEDATAKRLAEIAEEIRACPGKDPDDDPQWNDLRVAINNAEAKIGPPVSDTLEELENRKSGAEAVRDKYTEALAQADTAKKANASIAELGAKEKDLSQKIADCDKKLHDIGRYKAAESDLIAAAVNGRFEHVEFKLFKVALNGSIEPCCTALYHGRPFLEMSTGEQIICGVDVVNVLSTYYVVWTPLFIDHRESLTLPLEAKTQTIELYAADGVAELEVEVA